MIILDKFNLINAHSKGFESHDSGDIKFVTNGFFNNGVLGFVTPLENEKVFLDTAICVSAFCEATVQTGPFLPRGNGGSGLLVLVPRAEMSIEELYHYAAQINKHAWRFSFGRMVMADRLARLSIMEPTVSISVEKVVNGLIPPKTKPIAVRIKRTKEFPLTSLVEVTREYAPYLNQLDLTSQRTPYVTTTEMNNGVSLLCNEDPLFKSGTVTVSLDGICGTTFFQFEDYMAGEKTAVLTGKAHSESFMFYVAAMIRLKAWRYHYGRKLSMGRLQAMSIPLPVDEKEEIDYKVIDTIVSNSYGWSRVSSMAKSLQTQ